MEWTVFHDAAPIHYVAMRILAGPVPYRDIVDVQLPGTYLVHVLAVALFGPGDLAWRLFDLGWLAFGIMTLGLLLRPFGFSAVITAASWMGAIHLREGPYSVGQRDFLLIPFHALTVHGVSMFAERNGPYLLATRGLWAGSRLREYHQTVSRFLGRRSSVAHARARHETTRLSLASRNARGRLFRRSGRPADLRRCGVDLGARRCKAFISESLQLMRAYSSFGGLSLLQVIHAVRHPVAAPVLGAAIVYSALALDTRRGPIPWRPLFVLVGFAYGIAHVLIQAKAFEYHLYPFYAFTVVALSFGSGSLVARLYSPRLQIVGTSVLAAMLALNAPSFHRAADRFQEGHPVAARRDLVASMSATIEEHVPAGATIETLDTTL
ncbi:MAG: hypothetical protein ACT4QD_16205 [Acidobacteriota bacterium]